MEDHCARTHYTPYEQRVRSSKSSSREIQPTYTPRCLFLLQKRRNRWQTPQRTNLDIGIKDPKADATHSRPQAESNAATRTPATPLTSRRSCFRSRRLPGNYHPPTPLWRQPTKDLRTESVSHKGTKNRRILVKYQIHAPDTRTMGPLLIRTRNVRRNEVPRRQVPTKLYVRDQRLERRQPLCPPPTR